MVTSGYELKCAFKLISVIQKDGKLILRFKEVYKNRG